MEPAQLFSSAQQSTVRYKDLPYMGEMTLDNARPRRGRKPKKADICHLIYKNYGTTVVDEPLNLCLRDLQNREISNEVSMCKFKFTAGATPSLEEKKSVSLNPNTNNHNPNNIVINNSNKIHNNNSNINNSNFDTNRIRNKEIKRKSRKSLAKEKLEKTFKERGFLIQTQQLESAQGATYCKFRQLRKFTRYLFRSWKHHLPGDVVNTNGA